MTKTPVDQPSSARTNRSDAEEQTTPRNPYVGPRTFTFADRNWYFGRDREARDLLALVIAERLTIFYAQSGAGKSSLLNTQLIPALREQARYLVLPVGRIDGELPAGIDNVANIYTFNLLLSLNQSEGSDPARFTQMPLADFMAGLRTRDGISYIYDEATVQRAVQSRTNGQIQARNQPPHVLIIDQFEELVTTYPQRWREREAFFQQLGDAMRTDPLLWVVLTLHEDFIAPLDPFAYLVPGSLTNRFYMQRMGVDAALAAIKRPAEQADHPFAAGVAETLVDNLRRIKVAGQVGEQLGQYIEPVQLQVVCYQLWETIKGRELEHITEADLPTGYIDLSLTDFYNNALKTTLNDPSVQALQHTEGIMKVPEVTDTLLRQWFSTELITAGSVRNILLRDEARGRTGSLPNAAVDRLEQMLLVRTEVRAGRYWVELVHDRFVNPILKANELYITSTSASFASYDVPLMIQKATERVLGRYVIRPQTHKRIDMVTEGTSHEANLFSKMGYISTKGAYWLGARLKDTETWLAYLLSDLPNRFARLICTILSSIWALMTLVPSGVKRRSRKEDVSFGSWLMVRLKYGALRVMTLLFQISDLVGMPELFTIFWRALTHTKPLTYFDIIALTHLLGPAALRYKDVRIAEGGIASFIFKFDWFRRQQSFTLFHTINLMNKENLDFRILLFELTQVIQYERIGSVYLMESAIADLTTGYSYGGTEGLRQDQNRGKHYRDYNRLQQAKIVADYFSMIFYGQDASVYLPLIDEFRAGKL